MGSFLSVTRVALARVKEMNRETVGGGVLFFRDWMKSKFVKMRCCECVQVSQIDLQLLLFLKVVKMGK